MIFLPKKKKIYFIKILIVNFHYDLIMPNIGCAVILQKKEGHMNIYGHMNMYGHILYIIIYWCLRDYYVLLCFFFRFLFFET